MMGLSDGEKSQTIWLPVLTECTNVTADRRTTTDTHIAWRLRPRLILASRGKKLQSNGKLYSKTVIGKLAVDGLRLLLYAVATCYCYMAVTFGTARRGLGGQFPPARPVPLFLVVSNITTHPSTAIVPTSYYYCTWHYNCLCTING